MIKKIIGAALSAAMIVSAFAGLAVPASAANEPQYQQAERQMEKLNRGLVAVYTTADTRGQTVNGVVLSWRLLGDESLSNQAFDIYRNGTKIHTTGVHDATYYRDTGGNASSAYKVVKAGASAEEVAAEPAVTPMTNFSYAKPSDVGNGNSYPHSFGYVDIPIVIPDDVARMGDGKTSTYKRGSSTGGANDASVGDLDGDGDYEIVLKWDPQDSKDSAGADFTGNVYIDAYEIDPNNGGYKWRIDLGKNVTAGAHYTQFMVYDFDGDGKAEVAMKTAPGSIDGTGHYVSEAGDTDEIRNVDNEAVFIGLSGRLKGKNPFTQYLTIFDGETGKALYTTDFIPYEMHKDDDWGDGADAGRYNRSERYLAAVAYLDGVHPSLIMCRGYYHDAVIRAYSWDGKDLSLTWEHDGNVKGSTMFGQGNHNLSVADVDNDGRDEIVYGSAVLDDDGKTVLGNTLMGHGDAMHVSDFNNDGKQEVFSVKEDSEGFSRGMDFRDAESGKAIWSQTVTSDNGRGLMGNIDDTYAAEHPEALSLGWDLSHSDTYDFNGNPVSARPSKAGSGDFCNFLVYWDGDLASEVLDANIIQKYDAANGWTKRFYGPSDGYTLSGSTNNDSKRNYSLVADIWGDWREEIIMPVADSDSKDTHLRIFTSLTPTDYRLTTLMHDSQYREAIAWQNVGYNQPPHTSYYIGSAALATDDGGNKLNYLAPATKFTNVTYTAPEAKAVTGLTLSSNSVRIEQGRMLTISPSLTPVDAFPKTIVWTSSDESVATVSQGTIRGIREGKAVVTASTPDGTITAACEVEVYINHVTGVSVTPTTLELGTGMTKQVTASVEPSNASDKGVTWTSGDESVVTVDSDGNVTAVGKEGSTYVMAETNDGGMQAYCYVVVYELTETDATGTNIFTANDGSGDFSNNTATSMTFKQSDSAVGADIRKDFEAYSDNRAKISFKFTTGGQRVDGSNWNWTGHEYTFGLKFLDTEGNNILTISQAYTSGAQGTMSAVADNASAAISSDWTRTVSDGENPIGRSTTRWIVNLEFDYDNDTCTATLAGATSAWVSGIEYQKTFSLNGASFETLQYYTTKDGNGGITVNPSLEDLTYTRIATAGPAPTFIPEVTPGPTKEPAATSEPTATPEPEAEDSLAITGIDGNNANVAYTVSKARDAVLIGAIYDGGRLVEVKTKELTGLEPSKNFENSIEFTNNISGYDLKVFLWDSLSGMTPVCGAETAN